jgi:hypothetical protein
MAHAIDPLVKEPREVLTGRLFNCGVEVGSLDVLPLILLDVVIDGFPERFFAKHESEHAQHRPAARIGIRVKELVGVAVANGHDGPAIALIPRLKVTLLIAVHLVKEIILTFVVFFPQRFEEHREGLVEPYLAPVPAPRPRR